MCLGDNSLMRICESPGFSCLFLSHIMGENYHKTPQEIHRRNRLKETIIVSKVPISPSPNLFAVVFACLILRSLISETGFTLEETQAGVCVIMLTSLRKSGLA